MLSTLQYGALPEIEATVSLCSTLAETLTVVEPLMDLLSAISTDARTIFETVDMIQGLKSEKLVLDSAMTLWEMAESRGITEYLDVVSGPCSL